MGNCWVDFERVNVIACPKGVGLQKCVFERAWTGTRIEDFGSKLRTTIEQSLCHFE
jgi:hypothetical protein